MDSVSSVIGFFLSLDTKSLLLFIVVFILTADYFKNRRPANFPPGPRMFPIVGNLFTVDHTKTHERTYGDVYSLRMGPNFLVVLNGFKVVKEALVKQADSFADLLYSTTISYYIISGDLWKQQRRFALFTLRNFGLGKKSLEPVILDEFAHCAQEITGYKGKPFNPHLIINNAVSNIICSMVFGHRFEYDDENFKKLLKMFEKLYNAFPHLMRRLPGPHQTIQNIWKDVKKFIREELKDHKQNWDPSDLRDYIDCYLNEIQTVDSTFDEENMVVCILELFLAGTETTSTTLRWGFLYMAKYPEIQEKVQAEIDTVIGQFRQPSMEDRVNMPYTDAVIHEIQRIGNIVPLNLPHSTTREVQLGGYTIPKGVTVIPSLTAVLLDKNEWETPHTFNPGHFLNEEGKFVKPAAFIPFSAGKRQCPGESLAKMELFLFFTSFMQRYTFSMPAGVKPVLNYRFGFTLTPAHYEICATLRQK
uniref:Cytochrome P450 2J1-like n=1 Tax=Sphaeramia orbicularis TaxID=375764 RepID=A0A672ZAW2_9TELE